MLILWLDCDREGEAIGYEVVGICEETNKRMQVLRAHFSALIPRDIHNAMRTLTPPNPHLRDAVEARQEIDLRIGAAFTRFQTLQLQKKFAGISEFNSGPLSYGPCQFPTLGFVCDREIQRRKFVSQPFWTIDMAIQQDTGRKTRHRQEKGGQGGMVGSPSRSCAHLAFPVVPCPAVAKFTWERHRLFDRRCVLALYEDCVDEGTALITECNTRETRKRSAHGGNEKGCGALLRVLAHRPSSSHSTCVSRRQSTGPPRHRRDAEGERVKEENLCLLDLR